MNEALLNPTPDMRRPNSVQKQKSRTCSCAILGTRSRGREVDNPLASQLLLGSSSCSNNPDYKVHGANMGPTWGRQDPGWPHVGPMNVAISERSLRKSCVWD